MSKELRMLLSKRANASGVGKSNNYYQDIYQGWACTLEISGGIYNTAGKVSSRETVGGKTQISLLVKRRRFIVWRSRTRFREGVATPDYNNYYKRWGRAIISI